MSLQRLQNLNLEVLIVVPEVFLPRDASAERGYEIACRLSVCNVQVP